MLVPLASDASELQRISVAGRWEIHGVRALHNVEQSADVEQVIHILHTAVHKPLPESDPDSDDPDGQDGAGDAGASAKPTKKGKDTPGVPSAKPVKKRASEAAKAAQAGPSSVAPGRAKRSRA